MCEKFSLSSNIRFKRKGFLFIISAPSGVGKNTLIKHVITKSKNLKFSISATTRFKRDNEIEGVDYYFKSKEEFNKLIKENAFLEYAEIYGNLYGTLKSEIINNINSGNDVIMDVDNQGATLVKEILPEDTVTIYVLPPSIQEVEKRIRQRNKDSEDIMKYRIANSKKEITFSCNYDYIIINDDLNTAINDIYCIIQCNRNRTDRIKNITEIIAQY